MELLFQKWK